MAIAIEHLPAPIPATDEVFGAIAELAAQVCNAAYAAITLHEGGVNRPVATCGGIDLAVLPRDTRFCCEVLHSGAPLEVSDAQFDMRYHDDPLVTGAARIRFYSGVPLVSRDGHVAGTLTVFDRRAKVLSTSQREALWKLADVGMQLPEHPAPGRAGRGVLCRQAQHAQLPV